MIEYLFCGKRNKNKKYGGLTYTCDDGLVGLERTRYLVKHILKHDINIDN